MIANLSPKQHRAPDMLKRDVSSPVFKGSFIGATFGTYMVE
jgi:hypothetical protein|tara:strand:- start:88 stop:210 length:123 start_codon:yes stop_codon:yes gene_type:complete